MEQKTEQPNQAKAKPNQSEVNGTKHQKDNKKLPQLMIIKRTTLAARAASNGHATQPGHEPMSLDALSCLPVDILSTFFCLSNRFQDMSELCGTPAAICC